MSNARFSILQAVAVSDRRVSDAQFRTLAALGMYADKNGWCYPSLKRLGADLKKSPQAVGRDTIALRKLGYIDVKNRYDGKTKSRHSNLYRLKFDIVDFNVDDSTLSTSDVDTLSTSDVEVNVPINAPKNLGSFEPTTIEQAIWAEKPVTEEMVNPEKLFRDKVKDTAHLLDMGCKGGGDLAAEFMLSRWLIIPESKIKGNRKAAREMLEMGVKPEHVAQAVADLTAKGMTITDLFSISKTAIDLANKSKNTPVSKSFGL